MFLEIPSAQIQVYNNVHYNIFLRTINSTFKKHTELWKEAALEPYKHLLCIDQISMTYGYLVFFLFIKFRD